MTGEKDLVLIYFEDNPLVFARIEDISADIKKDWYHVRLLMLQLPLQIVTWILRDVYIDGQEFTMNGKRMRLEKVEAPATEASQENETSDNQSETPAQAPAVKPKSTEDPIKPESKQPSKGKVISLADHKSS